MKSRACCVRAAGWSRLISTALKARLVRNAYLGYLTLVGSALGWLLHGDPATYRYIPESIRRYPGARGVASLLAARGFADVRVKPLLAGLISLHVAQKSHS